MPQKISARNMLAWFFCLCPRLFRQRRLSKHFMLNSLAAILFFILLHLYFTSLSLPSTMKNDNVYTGAPFDHLIPSDPFDLFWTMWNTDQSTFRGRRLLVLESIFIHHPHATVIMLSSTLNDTKLFLPFRRRGYHIYSFHISLSHILQWKWYLNNQTEDFVHHWNSSSTYFYSHVTDYLRAIVLYLYGGTYIDMDALILQPLPNEEFIGHDDSSGGVNCTWCVRNTSGLYFAPGFMRFHPHRTVLRDILEQTFDRRVYVESCFNCVGPKAFTEHIIRHRDSNDPELTNLRLLQPYRLYPFMWNETLSIFHNVKQDTSLQLADLMKRSYSLHLFGRMSDDFSITRGSLIDLLFDRFDLGDLRPKIPNRDELNNHVYLIYPSLYIYTIRKQGRFIGRDMIYLRLNQTFGDEYVRWNITIHVSNGIIDLPNGKSLSNLNQAQVNFILNKMSYTPFKSTSIDTLIVNVKNENVSVRCSLTILVFSKWVTVLTKTMGTIDRWSALQQQAASVEKYFPRTNIRIASDSGLQIDKFAFLDFTSSEGINGYDLLKTLFIHNLPEDSGLSVCRNYLINRTSTPFFFLMDDDFVFEEDSHIDLLLELIYTHQHIDIVAGKIPEDIRDFHDYSGRFLLYNQTLELIDIVPNDYKGGFLFDRTSLYKKVDKINPCRQVDFVPNVFMGRTESIRSVRWNDDFKVGEHEDFFIRFGQANRSVYTCQYIQVHHRQIPWWKKPNSTYYEQRTRASKYFVQMLTNHHFRKLIIFNYTHVDLNESAGARKNTSAT